MRKTCPRCTAIIDMNQPLCPSCLQKDNQRRAAKSRRHGTNTAGWQRFRRQLIRQRGGLCEHCGTPDRLTLHYTPGGAHTRNPADYLVLCLTCHAQTDAPRAHLNR